MRIQRARPSLSVLLFAAVLAAGAAHAAAPAYDAGEVHALRKPKAALDDRVDTRMHASQVGLGTHMGRRPTRPGVYFDDKNREAVHAWFAAHPPRATVAVPWTIGQRVPANVALAPLPAGLRADLPRLPPGHKYVEAGGNVLLVAIGSNMVVDGIADPAR